MKRYFWRYFFVAMLTMFGLFLGHLLAGTGKEQFLSAVVYVWAGLALGWWTEVMR